MNRNWINGVSCLLLALVIGASVWLAWPTGRAFSYLNDHRPSYLIDRPMTVSELRKGMSKPKPAMQTSRIIRELKDIVGANGDVYSVPGSSMQDRLNWRGTTATNLSFVRALGDYRAARGLQLMAGREPGVNRPELALSEEVARQLTDQPAHLLGQTVILNPQTGGDRFTVTGIVRSSVWRSEDDPDAGGYRVVDPSLPGLDELDVDLLRSARPRLTIVFRRPPDPAILNGLRRYIAAALPGMTLVDQQAYDKANPDTQAIVHRLQERARALPLLAGLLATSGLLSLGTLMLAGLLRHRSLLGVELALGAARHQLMGELVGRQLWPAVLGASAGTALVVGLPKILPDILVGAPPLPVLGLAWGLPTLTMLILSLLVASGVLRDSAFALLRGAKPGQFVRPLLGLMLLAFVLALGGLLSALGVKEKLDGQAGRVRSEFGRVIEFTTTGDPESRTGAGLTGTSRRITVADLPWFAGLTEVAAVSTSERLNPDFRVKAHTVSIDRPVAGDRLPEVLNIRLIEGQVGGCLISRTQAVRLGLGVGSVVGVPSGSSDLPCKISGLIEDPDALKRFVMQNFPAMLVPSRIGLVGRQQSLGSPQDQQPVPLDPKATLTTTNILLRLNQDASPTVMQTLRQSVQKRFPSVTFALRPYAPNINVLLERLQSQSLMFLALAGAGSVMTLLGMLGSFVAYLDARRYRLALDRAQGLSLRQLCLRWGLAGVGLGTVGAGLALVIATALTPALYNAFSLDAPVGMSRELLPRAAPAVPGPLTLAVAVSIIALLGLAVIRLAERWLARQSLISLLKAGS